jgi:hypothetical protein
MCEVVVEVQGERERRSFVLSSLVRTSSAVVVVLVVVLAVALVNWLGWYRAPSGW